MVKLIKWLIDHNWEFSYRHEILYVIYTNQELYITKRCAKQYYKMLKSDKNYK